MPLRLACANRLPEIEKRKKWSRLQRLKGLLTHGDSQTKFWVRSTCCPVRSPNELNFRKDVVTDILSGAEHSSRKVGATRRYRKIERFAVMAFTRDVSAGQIVP